MRAFVVGTFAAAIMASYTFAAQAVTVTLTDTITVSGDTLVYSFTGLPTLAAGDGRLTLATIGTGLNGIDLGSDTREYMDVDADGLSLGRWECGAANDGGQLIPGHTGANDCLFSFLIDISAPNFAGIIADGSVTVSLFMGPGVTAFSGQNERVQVTLSYTDVAPIPLPASLPLLAAGVGGFALIRRRRRA